MVSCLSFLFILALALSGGSHAEPVEAWTLQGTIALRGGLGEQAVDDLNVEHPLVVNFKTLQTFFSDPTTVGARGDSSPQKEEMVFQLPKYGSVRCTLFPSDLFAPELQASLGSTFVLRNGDCDHQGMHMFMNLDLGNTTSLSATFSLPGDSADWFYVDHVAESRYTVYVASRKRPVGHSFSCGTHTSELKGRGLSSSRSLYGGAFLGIKLRLAMATNTEFSKFHGDTKSGVASGVAAVMSRVNGIYMHEFGIFFQLTGDTHKLFCVQGSRDSCDLLPNSNGIGVLNKAKSFITSRGVPSSSYDLGHVFTTDSGGIAGLAVLCTAEKAKGTTGVTSPVGDPFSVDYVAHEIGHQLNGFHTFRDCNSDDYSNVMEEAAVEPGSGSTIMGYAGICDSASNLQSKSDAYFHPVNLPMMGNFVHRQVTNLASCGLSADPIRNHVRPRVVTTMERCVLPTNRPFFLFGEATNAQFYQWDHMDPGVQEVTRKRTPRFRSWKPRSTGTRFFPNLFYLTKEVTEDAPYWRHERVPSSNKQLGFRFVARSLYDDQVDEAIPNAEHFGDYAFADFEVEFDDAVKILRFLPATRGELEGTRWDAGVSKMLSWTVGGGGAAEVEISVAINPMVALRLNTFEASSHILDLEWVSLGKFANTGSAMVKMTDFGEDVVAGVMINSVDNPNCATFDFVPKVNLRTAGATSTTSPAAPTTMAPTVPTSSPVSFYVLVEVGSPAVEQALSTCTIPEERCSVLPTGNCADTTKVVGYRFVATQQGTFGFSTAGPGTCKDTTLFAPQLRRCNDDARQGVRSYLEVTLEEGQELLMYVGGYENSCDEGETVSMTVTMKPPITRRPTTNFPTRRPITQRPTTGFPTRRPITQQPNTGFPTKRPSSSRPTMLPSLLPTWSPTGEGGGSFELRLITGRTQYNYHQAARMCASVFPGGTLAKIASQEDSEEARWLLANISGRNKRAWIGLDDIAQEGKFRYKLDGTELGSFSNWCPGEPNNQRRNQDCVVVDGGSKKCPRQWFDWKCAKKHPNMLCSVPSSTYYEYY